MDSKAARLLRKHALSLTSIASSLLQRQRNTCGSGPARDGGIRTYADFPADNDFFNQNGLVGKYLPSRVITAREPPSGSSTFLMSSLKLMALMMPSPNCSWTRAFSVEP
ncbi:hypothetical protein PS691_02086 [Pseudomonas fluorescens]|uniref:Uncharacterized protein n=1 Tax=Pseudomonas fluorescens TaxID=294 RepID=A0A5E7BQ52_PSEFL|nr:hypothetical protein PS691_02086 [Pseudomonas fluorescens]